MPSAEIVASWQDATTAHIAVAVDEGPARGRVEYLASLPVGDLAGKSAAQKKVLLAAAVKAVRDAQLAPPTSELGIGGTVSI